MKTNSIAAQMFDKFHDEYRKENAGTRTILYNLLPEFVEEVADAWGYEFSLNPLRSHAPIDGSKPLFEAEDLCRTGGLKLWVVTENGNVYAVGIKHYETGGTTWNGDDEFYKNMATDYIHPELVGLVSTIKSIDEPLKTEKMENIAAELVSVILQ